jgi:stearoyl-CoA desaturase (delta-9 desaturase)
MFPSSVRIRMSAPAALTPAVRYDAGSTSAPWNQPEVETVTDSDLRQSLGERIVLGVFIALPFLAMVAAVPDHRKHHKFSDKDGDPHSPWRFGTSTRALAKGLAYAHVGWLFDVEQTDKRQYVPDLLRDKDISRVSRAFPALVAVSLLFPPLVGGLVTWSWTGAATAFFWASLVRVGLLHHVTWSINSICHAIGERPFASRDRAGNVWWLAALSMGESWHNLHHADPTCARHGVLRGQIDSSARVIRIFEKLGWATSVRWPRPERLTARRAA